MILNLLSKVETVFSDDKMLKSLIESESVLESIILSLKKDASIFISMMVNEIIEKAPMKYGIVHNSSCLNPQN